MRAMILERAGVSALALFFVGVLSMLLNGRFLMTPATPEQIRQAYAGPSTDHRQGIASREPDFQIPVDGRSGHPRETSYPAHWDAFGDGQHPYGSFSEDRTAGRIGGQAQSQSFLHRKFKFHGENQETQREGHPKV